MDLGDQLDAKVKVERAREEDSKDLSLSRNHVKSDPGPSFWPDW